LFRYCSSYVLHPLMVLTFLQTAYLLALASGAVLLRGPTGNSAKGKNSTHRYSKPHRQKLDNYYDLQYFAEMKVGTQVIKGIMDTGSFELVTFSKHCTTCGRAAAYNERASVSYLAGKHKIVQAYGSGSCKTSDGFDTVSFGPYKALHQAFWEATSCQMPVLDSASFNAIVGIGPPGQPEYTAREELADATSRENTYGKTGTKAPKAVSDRKKQCQDNLKDSLEKPDLLENMGVSTFSVCFGRNPGSPAWLTWNDKVTGDIPGLWKVKVVGEITWSVIIKDLGLHRHHDRTPPKQDTTRVGCKAGCTAIVDTGTSLFGVPSDVYESIERAVGPLDCNNLRDYPDLVMNLGGHEIRFPPSGYIGSMYGMMSADAYKFMRHPPSNFRRAPMNNSIDTHAKRVEGGAGECQLLLMDLGYEVTKDGPLFILGMPFFREYYTTFDLGGGRGKRFIHVAPADDDCQRAKSPTSFRSTTGTMMPFQVDASKLRPPHHLVRTQGAEGAEGRTLI